VQYSNPAVATGLSRHTENTLKKWKLILMAKAVVARIESGAPAIP
jgi:hypothetical protein